jgi:nucleoid-associated protein YgaU
MFNPYEYTISKRNTYQHKAKNNADVVHAEFKEAGSQQLRLNLTFDTYEERENNPQSIVAVMNTLWQFMEVKTNKKKRSKKDQKVPPPYVAFEWGVFRFVAVITDMTQRYTLFLSDGTPVRAKVDVTFTQFNDLNDFDQTPQLPTVAGKQVEQVLRVVAGQRLDAIANQIYGDASRWREIADQNRLPNPLALRSGQQLLLPQLD